MMSWEGTQNNGAEAIVEKLTVRPMIIIRMVD